MTRVYRAIDPDPATSTREAWQWRLQRAITLDERRMTAICRNELTAGRELPDALIAVALAARLAERDGNVGRANRLARRFDGQLARHHTEASARIWTARLERTHVKSTMARICRHAIDAGHKLTSLQRATAEAAIAACGPDAPRLWKRFDGSVYALSWVSEFLRSAREATSEKPYTVVPLHVIET